MATKNASVDADNRFSKRMLKDSRFMRVIPFFHGQLPEFSCLPGRGDFPGRGEWQYIIVEQKATHRPAMRQGRCEWIVRLNQELATALKVQFGAGKAELRLSGLMLTRLQVESGVGELTLDPA